MACSVAVPLSASADEPDPIAWTLADVSAATWSDAAVNDDGSVFYVTSGEDFMWRFTGANSWAKTAIPTGEPFKVGFYGVATDDDGSTVIATTMSSRSPRISVDSGATWKSLGLADGTVWKGADVDGDGSTILLSSENGQVLISDDGGATTKSANVDALKWQAVSVSDDGKTMAAVAAYEMTIGSGERRSALMVSTDGGQTWEARGPATTNLPYTHVDVSGDGATIVASMGVDVMRNPIGQVLVSHDSGATFSTPSGKHANWTGVSVDDDGSTIVASADGSGFGVSRDGGATWESSTPVKNAWRNDVSGDGSLIVAGSMQQGLYLGNTVVAKIPVISGQPTSTAAAVGGTATFTVAGSGVPTPTVKWQAWPVGATEWADVPDATTGTLTLSNVAQADDGTTYRAILSNSQADTYSDYVTLTVGQKATVANWPGELRATVGLPFSSTPQTAGLGPFEYGVASGSLPDGLVLDDKTGAISGTPTKAGAKELVLAVKGRVGGNQYPVSFSIVEPAPEAAIGFDFAAGALLADDLTISATGADLEPGSEWTLHLHSDPQLIAGGTVADDGTVIEEVQIPASTPAGSHRLLLSGVGLDGDPVTAEGWFAVDAAGRIVGVSLDGPVAMPADGTVGSDADAGIGSGAAKGGDLASAGFDGGAAGLLALLVAALGAALFSVARVRRRA